MEAPSNRGNTTTDVPYFLGFAARLVRNILNVASALVLVIGLVVALIGRDFHLAGHPPWLAIIVIFFGTEAWKRYDEGDRPATIGFGAATVLAVIALVVALVGA